MDDSNPMHDVPVVGRYDEARDYSRGPSGRSDSTPTTLEQEVAQGGWTKRTRPEGMPNYAIVTIGMRGDPDGDDDQTSDTNGSYRSNLTDTDY